MGGFPTATSTGSDLAAMARGAGVAKALTVDTLDDFQDAFTDALEGDELTTIVAKVEARGPEVYLTDLHMLENRFEFQRQLALTPDPSPETGRGG